MKEREAIDRLITAAFHAIPYLPEGCGDTACAGERCMVKRGLQSAVDMLRALRRPDKT